MDIYDAYLDQAFGDSYRTFLMAIQVGFQNYSKDKDKFLTNLKDTLCPENMPIDKLQYQIFEVEKYRQEGLLPIKSY